MTSYYYDYLQLKLICTPMELELDHHSFFKRVGGREDTL